MAKMRDPRSLVTVTSRRRLAETLLCVDSDTQAAASSVCATPVVLVTDTNCLCPSQPTRIVVLFKRPSILDKEQRKDSVHRVTPFIGR